jgi:hypothetical protein
MKYTDNFLGAIPLTGKLLQTALTVAKEAAEASTTEEKVKASTTEKKTKTMLKRLPSIGVKQVRDMEITNLKAQLETLNEVVDQLRTQNTELKRALADKDIEYIAGIPDMTSKEIKEVTRKTNKTIAETYNRKDEAIYELISERGKTKSEGCSNSLLRRSITDRMEKAIDYLQNKFITAPEYGTDFFQDWLIHSITKTECENQAESYEEIKAFRAALIIVNDKFGLTARFLNSVIKLREIEYMYQKEGISEYPNSNVKEVLDALGCRTNPTLKEPKIRKMFLDLEELTLDIIQSQLYVASSEGNNADSEYLAILADKRERTIINLR